MARLRTNPVPLAVAAVVAVAGAAPLAAQASDLPDGPVRASPASTDAPDPAPRITGLFDVPWHADSAEIVERLGPPISVARVEEGLRIFTYTPWFLDRDGFLGLWIEEGEGMVHASYEPVVGDCTGMLRAMVRELNRRHRGLSPSTRGDLGDAGLQKDLCLAAMEDGARLTVRWEDAAGNRIEVGSRPGRPALTMTATSAGWERP